MNDKYLLLKVMYLNHWHLLPEYPFKESLELMADDDKEVMDYCKKVLSNMFILATLNK
jgi:hypothetical protein